MVFLCDEALSYASALCGFDGNILEIRILELKRPVLVPVCIKEV